MTRAPLCLAALATVVACFIALAATLVHAVEITPGQVYAGGTSLTASAVGVPNGRRPGLPAGTEALVMERIAVGARAAPSPTTPRGQWIPSGVQPTQGQLRLQTSEGVSTYALALAGEKLYLDGAQWLRADNEFRR